MEKNKKKIILLCVLVGIFILIIISVCFLFVNKDNNLNKLLVNDNKHDGVSDTITKDEPDDVVDNFADDSLVNKEKEENINSFDKKEDNYSEEDVVRYFENMGNEVEKSSSFKEKFKEYFIAVVDFIFYDKEINGYTFDGLSGTAKAKIIGIALKIDSKIEGYAPNYKENIYSTSNKVYTDIKDKLIVSYMDVATDICKNNEKECIKVKEIFGEIKDVCKIGWDFIKGLFKGGFSKVKDWYEIYSGK